jgi:uncharacterized BrkB/YihY/UPF0761 family membrane protein
LTTIAQIWFKNNQTLHHDVLASINNYFPLLGNQLQNNIHTMHRTGLGLIVGLLLTIYGARGAADALRFALDNVWHVPKSKRPGFPKSMLQSLLIMAARYLGKNCSQLCGVLDCVWHNFVHLLSGHSAQRSCARYACWLGGCRVFATNAFDVYGIFAIVLGLLFWLYLLAQIIVYAAEFDSVRHLKLWPRALDASQATPADQHATRFHQTDLEID